MHRNAWWLTRKGPTLDAGAFLVGLEYATERKARIVGKPSPESFRQGFGRLAGEARERGEPRLLRREVAMVGDDVRIDIGGARRAGLRGIFVRTGKHGDAELADAAARSRGAVRPDGVAASIAEVVAALG
jgi:ribonucleotide monophosphatase NagD (HAD superfamily)